MKKLTPEHIDKLEKIRGRLDSAQDALATAVDLFNDAQADAFLDVSEAVVDYNRVVKELNEVRQEIYAQQQEFYDEFNPEGTEYGEWMEYFEGRAPQIDVDEPEPLGVPDHDLSDYLDVPKSAEEIK